nr:hypothetical protein BaRGS_016258 [Batillaria attramentaria]
MNEGIRQAAQFLINANRSDAVNVMVVMTTGQSFNPTRTRIDSFLVRQMGIQTFALGITNAVDRQEIQSIGNQQSSQWALAPTYDDVPSRLAGLLSNVCRLAARTG